MKTTLFLIIVLQLSLLAQDNTLHSRLNLYSPENIRKFADYLFCSKDYLRAAEEYEKILNHLHNDTIEIKIAFAYSLMGNSKTAAEKFYAIKNNSSYYNLSRMEYAKTLFQMGEFDKLDEFYLKNNFKPQKVKNFQDKLHNISFLLRDKSLPEEQNFLHPFDEADKKEVKSFFEWKSSPPYKSPLKAAVLSAILPGAGKIYSGELSDGIIAALATGIFGYLTYNNFKAGHNFRGWLFSGVTGFFYAGSIYGSAAAVQIYNAKITFDFVNSIKVFLEDRNYYSPKSSFCR